MPTTKQIHAAAKVAIKYGCDRAHAEAMARYMLLAVENLDKADLFDVWPKNYGEEFWRCYPEKVGKGAMLAALEKVKLGREVTWEELLGGLARYIEHTNAMPDRQWCHPATWLNQKRWADQFAPVKENGRTTNGFAAIARQGV
jgi:hypothetical protein